MKRTLIVFILLLCMSNDIHSQSVEIFGYVEPQLMAARVHDTWYQLSSNKLRLDVQAHPSDRVMIGANINWITYHGTTEWDILDFLPKTTLSELLPMNYLGVDINPYILPYNDRQYLDNAFVKLNLGRFDLTIGKQQISLGTGYVWNPTDVYNRKDVLDPTYEQPGHNAVRLDLPLSRRLSLTTIYSPDKWNETGNWLVKFKGRLGHFDLSVCGMRQAWPLTDARIFDIVMMKMYQLPTTRENIGGDLAGELFGIGVWMEAVRHQVTVDNDDRTQYRTALENYFRPPLWSSIRSLTPPAMMDVREHYYELVAGLDYTFDFQTYIMVEFYRNTWAKADYHHYHFNDWMQLLIGESKTIARDQLYMLIQHPATDLIQVGCSALYASSDRSGAIIPMITWNAFDDVDVTLIGNYYFGNEGTAYSKTLGNGGLARVRVYF